MRNSFYISGNYTKHYYAGTQRVSSKIGTTENLGDYLYDWFTGGMGGPVDVIGSSFGVLENAEQGVVQVYDEFGIDPPTYESNPMFIPVQSFTHGGNEVEQYFFHPDHLGSTSYITNLLGEVSQHMEYFAFGETFVEEHRSSNNSPYKFNGKELDEETGWYYYGARYYDPKISVWLSVDPLANVDYLMNDEAYINGEHNGGVFNSFNNNSYAYTYQNPILYIDPNGKQVEWSELWENTKEVLNETGEILHHIAHDFAPIRPLDENDPQTLTESWEVIKSIPSNIVNAPNDLEEVYKNGSTKDKITTTIGIIALFKGKGSKRTTTVSMGFNPKNRIMTFTQKAKNIIQSVKVPDGFEIDKGVTGSKTSVFKQKGKNVWISPDLDGHKGGIWKRATGKSENILTKKTREGTYNADLTKKLGD